MSKYLTVAELAVRLRQKPDWVRKTIIRGRRIEVFKPSPRKTLFPIEAVCEFERTHTVESIR